MSNVKSFSFAKIAFAFAIVLFAFAFVAFPAQAAFTSSQTAALEAAGYTSTQIAALEALVGGGSSTPSSSCTVYGSATVVRPGMSGTAVTGVQMAVNQILGDSVLNVDGAYGPLTAAAVKSAQLKVGSAADGIWGPNTFGMYQAWLSANCTGEGTPGPGTGTVSCPAGYVCTPTNGGGSGSTLSGGAGSIQSADQMSKYSSEQVGEGNEDVTVYGIELEADPESDLRIQQIKIQMQQQTGADSSRLRDYMSDVSVWYKGQEVARVPVADFSKNSSNVYTKSMTLDSSVVITAGDTEELTIAVSALPTIDSADRDTDDWRVVISEIRYIDGTGAILTDSSTGVIGTAVASGVSFDFASAATAQNIEMKVALSNNDDINEAHVAQVSSSTDTDGVDLLEFTIEAKGGDIYIEDLDVLLTAAGVADVDLIVNRVELFADGDPLKSKTVSTSSVTTTTITFDDINFTITKGDKVTFLVQGDINDLESTFGAGDTLKAELTSTERASAVVYVGDQYGDSLGSGDRTGSASGEAISFYEDGINVTLVGTPSGVVTTAGDPSASPATNDIGSFTITFDVTAFGNDIYVDKSVAADNDGTYATGTLSYSYTNTSSLTGVTAALDAATATEGTDGFKVLEGQTERFTLTVAATATSADAFHRVKLESVSWATSDVGGTDNYTFNLTDFKTNDLFMNVN